MATAPNKTRWWSAFKIAGGYVVVGWLWIALSDVALAWLVSDPATRHNLQLYKGWFYVTVTAAGLYFLIRLAIRRATEAEEAGETSGRRYDELFENASDLIFTLDEHGSFTAANRAVEKLTGYTRNEILQLKITDLLCPDSHNYIAGLLDPQNTQNPSSVSEVRIKRRDGSTAILEISSRPLSLKDNSRKSIENIARDVTQRHLMEAEISAAKKRYELLIETANEGIWSVDRDFRITLINRKMCALTGFAATDVVGRHLSEFIASELLANCDDDVLSPQFAAKDHIDVEFERGDGTKIWLMVSSNPIFSGTEFDGVVYMATDITERKNAEVLLRESESRFRVLFEHSPIGGAIIDEQGRILECNRIGCELLGYTHDELIKLKLVEIDARHSFDELVAIHQTLSLNNRIQFETLHRRKDGAIRDVVVSAASLLIDGVKYGYASWLDVTEYKQASAALARSEERLQLLYRIIADTEIEHRDRIRRILELGIAEFSVDHALLGVQNAGVYEVIEAVSNNPRLGLGYTCDSQDTFCREVVRLNDILAIENVSATDWKDHRAFKNFGMNYYIGMPVMRSGRVFGTLCFISPNARTTPITKGDIEFIKLMAQWVGAELTRQDAEEALRRSEEQLLQAQKLESVGRLAGGIAHDFNNMLTAINGYSDLTLSRMSADDPLRHHIAEIKKAGERSSALTQQLLAFSRKQILKPETRNINSTVTEVITLLKRLIGEDISLVTRLSDDLRQTEIDNGKLTQVIVNLAVNARDAMPTGGTLTIETRNLYFEDHSQPEPHGRVGHYVVLAVSDTGVGMDEETRSRLFEPFFTTKDVGKGTGLGLATAYGFIKQSGGFISVESEPGAGSTFEIYLPASEFPEVMKETESIENNRVEKGEMILLVEDEELVRSFASAVLEGAGYRVIAAENAEQAVGICESLDLDISLLLTDVVMPQMNGRQLWEKVSADRPSMKVIFTSGYTDDTIVRSGIREDGANFLQKPFLIDDLLDKVREVLDSEIHRTGGSREAKISA